VNIYEDENAYFKEGTFKKTVVAGHRDYLGNVDASLKDMNHRKLVLGTRGRSGQQWDIWEATYSPIDKDGYPKRIWNRITGEIDKEVAVNTFKYFFRFLFETQKEQKCTKGFHKSLLSFPTFYV